MYGMLTRIVVKSGKRSELLDYLRWDAEVARATKPGTWRFDVWEAGPEPGVVYLYEAYKDRAAFDDHAKHEPYKKWDEIADKTMEQVTDVIPSPRAWHPTSTSDVSAPRVPAIVRLRRRPGWQHAQG